ncbi:MAG: hypothetical protein GY950_14235 [bacterium]|nr:hypothetical protein [bacterium]
MWEFLRRLRKQNPNIFLTVTGIFFSLLLVSASACGGEPAKETVEKTVPPGVKPAETVETTTGAVPTQGNVARISDIHFNPFYDQTLMTQLQEAEAGGWDAIFATSQVKGYGTYDKNESNYNLFIASLENMAAGDKAPDFVIFTGDFLAHEFHDKYKAANNGSLEGLDPFIKKTVTFMVLMFDKYFPKVPVYVSLGNNDSYAGDYLIVPEGPFLKDTTPVISDNWLETAGNKESFATTYPIGGYFAVVPSKAGTTRIISLNSIFFSPKRDKNFKKYDPGARQLEWFESQLKTARANKEKVWLLLHIPPGANVWGTVHDGTYKSFWETAYSKTFLQLVTTYSPVFAAGYAGHTHMDDWRLVFDRTQTPARAAAFVHICPAVSPQFGNNPAFIKLFYDRTASSLTDYDVFYLDLSVTDPQKWNKEYGFDETYGQTAITAATMQTVYAAIGEDETARTFYMNYYDVNHRKALTPENWKAYWCAIGNLEQQTFENCYKPD